MTVEEVKRLEDTALGEIGQAPTPEELESLRVKYLGRKGALTLVLRGLKDLPGEVRRLVGQESNRVKEVLEAALDLDSELHEGGGAAGARPRPWTSPCRAGAPPGGASTP